MSKFEKFLVIPYVTNIHQTSRDNDISQIINNRNLNLAEKSKLIDQLLFKAHDKNQNFAQKEQEVDQNDKNKNITQQQMETDTQNLPTIQLDFNKTTKRKKKKALNEYYNDDNLNQELNKAFKTKNNAEFFLNPALSTRKNTKLIKNKINLTFNRTKKLLSDQKKQKH